jgi:von Willebrand factor type A domain
MRKSGVVGSVLLVMFVVGCGAYKSEATSPGREAPVQPGFAPAAEAAPSVASAGGKRESAKDADGIAAAAAPPPPPPSPAPAAAPLAVESKSATRRALPQSGQLTAGVWDDNVNFDFWRPYAVGFRQHHGQDFAMFSDQELTAARDLANEQKAPRAELDVQLVLDTTGSMGDELTYLQSEFDAIAANVRSKFPNVTPRWSLVVYRDKGDDYVTREFDFTSDTNKFRKNLRAQSAGGGGDTPEAVVQGLGSGLAQSWRQQGNVAKIAFWVADAPAHPGEGRVLAQVIRDAKKKGVHIYPIASSDTDDAAEYQMRSAAQMTGGRYVFLTNDSGVGNNHAEPHIPCYNVTRLDTAIVRMIQVELSGHRVEAEQNEIVRAVGQPNKEGKCQLSSGMLVASY